MIQIQMTQIQMTQIQMNNYWNKLLFGVFVYKLNKILSNEPDY